MNIVPNDIMDKQGNYVIPEEANLKGYALVNKRIANMTFTVFGERSLTKMLQIGGSASYVEALGRVLFSSRLLYTLFVML